MGVAASVSLYTRREYPCGCKAEGSGDVPPYCAEHESNPAQAEWRAVLDHRNEDGLEVLLLEAQQLLNRVRRYYHHRQLREHCKRLERLIGR